MFTITLLKCPHIKNLTSACNAYFVGGFNDVGKYVDFMSSTSTIL